MMTEFPWALAIAMLGLIVKLRLASNVGAEIALSETKFGDSMMLHYE